MAAYDMFYGTVTLPDGRQVNGKLWGINHAAPDGFEVRDDDPLEMEWLDGTPLTEAEYMMEVGKNYPLHEYVMDRLAESGTFEPWEPDYD